MQVARLVGLERLVLWPGGFRLQIAQIAHPVPPQAAVEARARNLGVQELADHGERVVDRHQQRLAQNDRHRLLRRGQGRLQPVRCVAAIMHAVAVLPLVDGLLGRPEPLRKDRGRRVAGLDRRPNFRRRRRLLVKMDQHARTPLRMSLRTDLAMKNAERRGSM